MVRKTENGRYFGRPSLSSLLHDTAGIIRDTGVYAEVGGDESGQASQIKVTNRGN
jgi:hypothetical protein